MMYLILITVFLTAILRLKAEAVKPKPAARPGILLLLVLCAAAVPVGGPAQGFQCITPGTGVFRMRRIRCIPGRWK